MKLSEQVKEAIHWAKIESQRYKHYYIGVEHLFIGICKIEDIVLHNLLNKLQLNTLVFKQVQSCLIPDDEEPVWGFKFIYTPRAQKILELSEQIASHMSHTCVEPTHILLAILREGRSLPARLCYKLKSDNTELEHALKEINQYKFFDIKNDEINHLPPFLKQYGRDLTYLARNGKLEPFIGKAKELQELAFILRKKVRNNILILGEPGTGKTHLVEGFAQALVMSDKEPLKSLSDKRIIEVDINALVAGTTYRGDFEMRLQNIINETINSEFILFIDEIHIILKAGSAEGAYGAAQVLKPYLSRGDIQCIGTTTFADFTKYLEKDSAFIRRFEVIKLNEPSKTETLTILQGLKPVYENHHQIIIEEEALKAAVEYGISYFSDRFFPDKAIELLDTACAQSYCNKGEGASVRRVEIADIVYQRTGIRPDLSKDDRNVLATLEYELAKRIIGQEEAITKIVNTIRNARLGLLPSNRPVGVFFLCGLSGVGKTELVKALSEIMFNNALIRLDMSEYMEFHTVSRLIGSPPGYKDHEKGGILTEAVRRQPNSVVLFDEIEKAHPDCFNILLQIFDSGRLTDGLGRTTNFSNTLIFMTSNIGSNAFKGTVGFKQQNNTSDKAYNLLKKAVFTELEKNFKPELINRIDTIIVFNILTKNVLRKIIDNLLKKFNERAGLKERKITLVFDDSVYETLIKQGYKEEFGAREMERTIKQLIIDPFGKKLFEENFSNTQIITRMESNNIVFQSNPSNKLN